MDIDEVMTNNTKKTSGGNEPSDPRQARLSDALRANLKRRKAAKRKQGASENGDVRDPKGD